QADICSRVSGTVHTMTKNIGDPVQAGGILVEIDVPDLIQDVASKDALVKQALADLEAARADVLTKKEQVAAARPAVDEKAAALDSDKAKLTFARSQSERFLKLLEKDTIPRERYEEKFKAYQAAEASCKSSTAALGHAEADVRVAEAKVVQAEAEVK